MFKRIYPEVYERNETFVCSPGSYYSLLFGISKGFKQRMIAISKTISFHFLRIVWKCSDFIIDHQNFFKLNNYGGFKIKLIFMLIQSHCNGL
jgi:hypothetical protein